MQRMKMHRSRVLHFPRLNRTHQWKSYVFICERVANEILETETDRDCSRYGRLWTFRVIRFENEVIRSFNSSVDSGHRFRSRTRVRSTYVAHAPLRITSEERNGTLMSDASRLYYACRSSYPRRVRQPVPIASNYLIFPDGIYEKLIVTHAVAFNVFRSRREHFRENLGRSSSGHS